MMLGLLLLLGSLLTALPGVGCDGGIVFLYGRAGYSVLLPCSPPSAAPGCSSLTWSFFGRGRVRRLEEVSGGRVNESSDRAGRVSVTTDCSMVLRELVPEDAGTYVCQRRRVDVVTAYLSVLFVHSLSGMSELRPGGSVHLSCVLSTFYDTGNCKEHPHRKFRLSWCRPGGTDLTNHSRHQVTTETPCRVSLLLKLQQQDGGSSWRCQVDTDTTAAAAHLDFTSSFVFGAPSSSSSSSSDPLRPAECCPVTLLTPRLALCVALPLMVVAVGVISWRSERERAKALRSAPGLRESRGRSRRAATHRPDGRESDF